MQSKPNVIRGGETFYTIRRLTRDFDVTSRALRFYEVKGLLSPSRRGLTRLFSMRDVARLKLILLGKRTGFPLSEIKHMLDLYDQENGEVIQRRVALARGREQLKVLQRRREELASAIDELERKCRHIQLLQEQNHDPQDDENTSH